MPRNNSGVASVLNPPFQPNTQISSSQVNGNNADFADMLTGSLPRDGTAPMTASISVTDGTIASPGVKFASDGNTGIRRVTSDTVAVVAGGGDRLTVSDTAVSLVEPLIFAPPVTIASATTTDLGAAESNLVTISGTVAITSFGAATAGVVREVTASGAFTLTHNGTSLILPGGANIVAAAGDTFTAQALGGSNWRVTRYQRGGSTPSFSPSETVDNTVPRFDGTRGALQTSTTIINDDGSIKQTSTGAETIPAGTTAQRPTASAAMLRENTDANGIRTIEHYNGSSWRHIDRPLLYIRDQKSSGTNGGTFSNGAWRTRDLNTKVVDEIGSTLSSNQFTLPAGTYEIMARAPAVAVRNHALILRDVTGANDLLIGSAQRVFPEPEISSDATLWGRFTLSVNSVLQLQHRCTTSVGGTGFGVATGFGIPEIYAEVMIWRIS